MADDQQLLLSRSNSISSTATAPNLVGPGRMLGLFFDWLGKGLESKLNKGAAKFNIGPEAVARDIRRILRHDDIPFCVRYAAPYAYITKAKEFKVRKLCKTLLKYAQSVTSFIISKPSLIFTVH